MPDTPDDARRIDADSGPVREHNERIESLTAFFTLVDSIGQRFISPTGEGLELGREAPRPCLVRTP